MTLTCFSQTLESKVKVKVRKKEIKRKKIGEIKLIVTQGGTRTRNLANGLPYSNQLSYRVTWQLSGRVRVFKAELPGIQPKLACSRVPNYGSSNKQEVSLLMLLCP